MGGLALLSAIVCITLPETHNQPTAENLMHAGTSGQGERDAKKYGDHRETQTTAI